jgi:hypothetical protein
MRSTWRMATSNRGVMPSIVLARSSFEELIDQRQTSLNAWANDGQLCHLYVTPIVAQFSASTWPSILLECTKASAIMFKHLIKKVREESNNPSILPENSAEETNGYINREQSDPDRSPSPQSQRMSFLFVIGRTIRYDLRRKFDLPCPNTSDSSITHTLHFQRGRSLAAIIPSTPDVLPCVESSRRDGESSIWFIIELWRW